MAEAAGAAFAQAQQQPARVATTTTGCEVSARLQQVLALLFPSNLAAKAALFALVVALLPTSQPAPRIWELPHLLLPGIIISYGVFGQNNADAEVAAAADDAKPVVDDEASVEAYVSQMMQGSPLVFEDDDRDGDDGGGSSKVGVVRAWSSQYIPDDPLVVVADANNGDGGAGEKPLLLPMRKLKPAAKDEVTPTLHGDVSDGIEEQEEEDEDEEFLAPKARYYDVRERAIVRSPSSVLDADLTLSPSSSPPLLPPPPPPPPPPFLARGSRRRLWKAKARSFNEFGAIGNRTTNGRLGLHGAYGKQLRSKSAVQATRSAFAGYDPVVPLDDDAVDAELDVAAAASESSFGSDIVTDGDDGNEEDMFEEDEGAVEQEEDGSSCDEELFELATKQPGPEVDEEEMEDEVDRKADEFIAKFREQIRMQRVEPATRR